MHFGSLVTALASYLPARTQKGLWRVRVENIDPLREPPGASRQIVTTLLNYGFVIDGAILYQNRRFDHYRNTVTKWYKQRWCYACSCTRSEIRAHQRIGLMGSIYPGTCSHRKLMYRTGQHVLRLRYPEGMKFRFFDQTYGWQSSEPDRDDGDFVIYRRENLPSYALAASLDDMEQNYSEIVRGCDLLGHTFRQYAIHRICEKSLPRFRHIPLIVDKYGNKLSKQNNAEPLPDRPCSLYLTEALKALGQSPPRRLKTRAVRHVWNWALNNWDATKIPTVKTVRYFMEN